MTEDKDNILKLVTNTTNNNLEKTLKIAKEQIPIMLKVYKLQAQMYKERYNVLIAEGFNSEQALFLIKGT